MEAFGEKIFAPKIGVKVLDEKLLKWKQSVKQFQVGDWVEKFQEAKVVQKLKSVKKMFYQKRSMKNYFVQKMETVA